MYLPDELQAKLEFLAAAEGRSEAEFIRATLQAAVDDRAAPAPRIPLVDSVDDPDAARRTDELLAGFGER